MAHLTRSLLTVAISASMAAVVVAPTAAKPFPEVISLPDGWQAEGIATGKGTRAYAGSLATGAVWVADLRTGAGEVLVPAQEGRIAVGLKERRGLLFVAGGPTGQAYVYDAATGDNVADFQLGPAGTSFVNDVTVTKNAAWFTDSANATLYRLPLRRGEPAGDPQAVALTGDWQQVAGFNANGIAATANGKSLLVINSTTGTLYRVDPHTGVASAVETTATLTQGDGILLRGKKLAVVRNRSNEIAVLRMTPDLGSARLVQTLTDPDFAVPTTVAAFGSKLYVVNARFGQQEPDPLPFEIVKVDGS